MLIDWLLPLALALPVLAGVFFCCCNCGAGPFDFADDEATLASLGIETRGDAEWSIASGKLAASSVGGSSWASVTSPRPAPDWDSGAVTISAKLYKIPGTDEVGVWLGNGVQFVADWQENRYRIESVDADGNPAGDSIEVPPATAVPTDGAAASLVVIGKGSGLYDVRGIVSGLTIYTETDRALPDLDATTFRAGLTVDSGGAFDDFRVDCGIVTACCPSVIPAELCYIIKSYKSHGGGCAHNITGELNYNPVTEKWEGEFPEIEGCATLTGQTLSMSCSASTPHLLKLSIAGGAEISRSLTICDPFETRFCPVAVGEIFVFARGNSRCESNGKIPVPEPCNTPCLETIEAIRPEVEVEDLTATLSSAICACLNGISVTLSPMALANYWEGTFSACGATWRVEILLTSTGHCWLYRNGAFVTSNAGTLAALNCNPYYMRYDGMQIPRTHCDGLPSFATIRVEVTE